VGLRHSSWLRGGSLALAARRAETVPASRRRTPPGPQGQSNPAGFRRPGYLAVLRALTVFGKSTWGSAVMMDDAEMLGLIDTTMEGYRGCQPDYRAIFYSSRLACSKSPQSLSRSWQYHGACFDSLRPPIQPSG
jgi:hypothetical protein